VWFTDLGKNSIGRIDPTSHVVTEYPIGGLAHSIVGGTDGNVWYTLNVENKVGRITPAGVVTEFDTAAQGLTAPGAMSVGHDGNLWFLAANKVGVLSDASFVAPPALPANLGFVFNTDYAYESTLVGTLIVRRDGNVASTVTVNYTSSDGTALSGTNYKTISGTLTFGPDETSKMISVPVISDGAGNGDKTFKVTLSNPSTGAELGKWSETAVTIRDQSFAPPPPPPSSGAGTTPPADTTTPAADNTTTTQVTSGGSGGGGCAAGAKGEFDPTLLALTVGAVTFLTRRRDTKSSE
jgi:hypothetical protein